MMGARVVSPNNTGKQKFYIKYRPQGKPDPESGMLREDYKSLSELKAQQSYQNPGSFGAYSYTHRR
jgi:hypothetical protein